MNTVYWKNTIASIFLLSFLFVRIINIHTLSHIDQDTNSDDCELCEIIVSNNKFGPLANFNSCEYNIETVLIPRLAKVISNYSNPLETVSTPKFVYNKPPPTNS